MSVSLSKKPSKAQVVAALAEARAIKAQIALLEVEYRKRTDILARSNSEMGKHEVEGGTYTLSENNTYPESAVRALLTEGQARRCEVRKLDNKVVKALYPQVYEAAKVSNGVKVTVH